MAAGAPHIRSLTEVVTRLRRALRRSIRSEGARPIAQIEVLQSLRDTGTTRIGDLADRLRLAQSTASVLVTRLTSAGLVARDLDSSDRRAVVVTLTADGRRELRDWDAAHRKRLGAALRQLSAADRDVVIAALPALSRLVDALERDA